VIQNNSILKTEVILL